MSVQNPSTQNVSSAPSAAEAAASRPKFVAFFCSHTHWDREWYGSFQQFRYRLVRLIDRLMDLLERDPDYRCFNLDGQTIVLEDYLEVRPEQRPRLERLIREGRILIGPWYILPDEWLVSGEATIRNMLAGRAICREFGVEQPRVGYLPDMFGHLSQIPQLIRGFGWDFVIFWRGLSGDQWMSELWWEGADGTRVLSFHLPEYCGYCNASFFYDSLPREAKRLPEGTAWGHMVSEDPEYASEALRAIVARAQAKSRSGQLLLMNGVDHMEPQPQVPEILRLGREKMPDVEFRHATFTEFMEAVKAGAPEDLQVVRGEQRSTVVAKESGAIVLPNILSSRIQLKLANATCQTLLERWVEPFASAAAAVGIEYPFGLIRTAWKNLMKNHPHDSIGGCSIDEVHFQMEARFREVEDLATVLTSAALEAIADSVKTDDLPEDELAFLVFNPLNWNVTDLVRVTIDIDEDWLRARGVQIHPDNIYRSIRNLRIREWDGSPADYHIANIEWMLRHRPWRPVFGPVWSVVRFTVELAARDLPALGYKGYRIGLPKKERRLDDRHGTGNPARLENEHLAVEVLTDGTLHIVSKDHDEEMAGGLHYFEDGGDNGDGYTYSPPRHDAVATTLGGRVQVTRLADEKAVQAVAVDYTLDVPAGLAPNRQYRSAETVPMKIRSVFRLGPRSRRIDVETTLTNVAKDHRLRVCFAVPGAPETHHAEMQFDVPERPNAVVQPDEEVWLEDAPLERPQQSFVTLGKLAVAGFGLPEYEVVPARGGREGEEAVLKVTLLRAVNWLGAGGHANTIVGGAGPHFETPDQQLPGRTFTFRYSIIPHAGDWKAAGVQREAHQHNALWRGVLTGRHAGFLPPEGLSFFQVEGENLILSAVKRTEDDSRSYVIRFWNSGDAPGEARLTWMRRPASVALVNLAEEFLEELRLDEGGAVTVSLGAKRIATVRFTLAGEDGAGGERKSA